MTNDSSVQAVENKDPSPGLRKWPALCISLGLVAAVTIPGLVAPMTVFQLAGLLIGPLIGLALFAMWWLLFSRRPSTAERIGGVVAAIAAFALAFIAAEESVRMAVFFRGTTSVIVATSLWFFVAQSLAWRTQLLGAAVTMALVLAFWCTLRSEGVDGTLTPEFAWRWSPTKEQQYVESLQNRKPESIEVEQIEASSGDWVGFRGERRDSRIEGVRIETDWENNPPTQLWRRPIGPAWSSFAVIGNRIYTQEQRGEAEVVLCLDARTGNELWAHMDQARFWEAMAGAGPRATPTFALGNIFALGATGVLNCLHAVSGKKIWSADISADGKAEVPPWGFASSPLVVGDAVMVFAGGGPDRGVIAYRRDTGELLWRAGNGTHSYSSPQLVSLYGTPQVLMLTERGVFSVVPDSGDLLWEHEWPMENPSRAVQPNVMSNHVFVGTGFGQGTRSVLVEREEDRWQTTEEWTSRAISPYYNDFVIHEGHLYGFDGHIFACVDATTGKRKWKRGRYGNGQVLLIADQGLLLVISEKGEVVLLRATPDELEELGRAKAVHGKTWNHPVLSNGRLFVRNAEEAVCLSLSLLPAGQK